MTTLGTLVVILERSGLSYEQPAESDAERVQQAMDEAGYVLIQRQPVLQLLELLRRRATTELEIATVAQQPAAFEAEMLFPFEELKRLSSILTYLAEVTK